METQFLEGTLAEIHQQLERLPYAPEKRVRVTVEDVEPQTAARQKRNGITLVPVKHPDRVLTTEFVKELLDAE